MISLSRNRSEDAIVDQFWGQKRIENNRKLILQEVDILKGDRKKHSWDSKIWGKSKEQLLIESNNKCAYCEAPLAVVAYGDVEHYRPKSIYWWLAYCYDNYLVSCTICNQAFKKDKFPIVKESDRLIGPVVLATFSDADVASLAHQITPDPLNDNDGMHFQDFLESHSIEGALLVNPYYNDPADIFEYSVDEVQKEIIINVKTEVNNARKIQKAIVDTYGLNRLELRQLRFEWYDLYYTHKLIINEGSVSASLRDRAIQKIEDLKSDKSPFAGMIRYFES